MPVYMIRAGEHGPVKIGWSDVVEDRLGKMQIDNHEKLVVMRMFQGGILEETQLHALFADLHLHGEWHSFSKAMLGDVGLAEIYRHVDYRAPKFRPRSKRVQYPTGTPLQVVHAQLRQEFDDHADKWIELRNERARLNGEA
jgi:hypothetical protein